jgi:hypothetical protein
MLRATAGTGDDMRPFNVVIQPGSVGRFGAK